MLQQQQNLGRRFGASGMPLSPLVAWAAVPSGAVVLLLLTLFIVTHGLWESVIFYVLLYVTLCPFWYCNHLGGEEGLVTLLNLSSWCLVVVGRLFLAVPRGCLRIVIVVFPDHTNYFGYIGFKE